MRCCLADKRLFEGAWGVALVLGIIAFVAGGIVALFGLAVRSKSSEGATIIIRIGVWAMLAASVDVIVAILGGQRRLRREGQLFPPAEA